MKKTTDIFEVNYYILAILCAYFHLTTYSIFQHGLAYFTDN